MARLAVAVLATLLLGAQIASATNIVCTAFFFERNAAIAAKDYDTVLSYNQLISLFKCCSSSLNSYTCSNKAATQCGFDFQDYPSTCAACAVGVQFAGSCAPYLNEFPCNAIPMAPATINQRAGCFAGLLTQLVNYVNLSIIQPDYSLFDPQIPPPVSCPPSSQIYRQADGSCNSPILTYSGMTGLKFTRHDHGYNIPQDINAAIANGPNPRLVSNLMFRRDTYKTSPNNLNGLAFAWLNLFVHDFFLHENDWTSPIAIPVPADDPDFPSSNHFNEYYMYVPRSLVAADSTPTARFLRNRATAWFDGSQIYGQNPTDVNNMRTFSNGFVKMTAGGLPVDHLPPTSYRENIAAAPLFQIGDMRANQHAGAQAFHTLFLLEHNNLARQLAALYPTMTDEALFQTARMILAAELLKIQTVEMSVQLVDDPAQQAIIASVWQGTRARSYNPLATHITPEDFISAYRWHAMAPATLQLRDTARKAIGTPIDYFSTFQDTTVVRSNGISAVLVGLGSQIAGAVTLNNHPDGIRRLSHPSLIFTRISPFEYGTCTVVPLFDLGTTDIVRERERGGPKIGQYWRDLGFPNMAPQYWMNIAVTSPQALQLAQLYDWNIENVDFVVGMLGGDSEPYEGLPEVSTAGFIPFVISRAYSDRFFTSAGLTTASYTQFGLNRLFGVTATDVGVSLFQILLENGVVLPTTVPNPAAIFKTWA